MNFLVSKKSKIQKLHKIKKQQKTIKVKKESSSQEQKESPIKIENSNPPSKPQPKIKIILDSDTEAEQEKCDFYKDNYEQQQSNQQIEEEEEEQQQLQESLIEQKPSKTSKKTNQKQLNNNNQKQKQEQNQIINFPLYPQKPKLNQLSICIPDSIISIPQSSELRSYFISELARTAAIFCVDEIIILKDPSYKSKSTNFEQGPYIARNLQYLETPQYLRKHLFPIHPDLKNAGLMNPIECHHHLKSDQYCKYREGVVVSRPFKEGEQGSWVEIGLKKQAKINYKLAPNTRITIKLQEDSIDIQNKNYNAEIVSQKEPKEKLGLFWGYQVRLADNLTQVFKGENDIKYDIKVLINQGDHEQFSIQNFQSNINKDLNGKNLLVVFSGYNNFQSIVDSDEYSKITGDDALLYFDANFTLQKGNFGVKQLRLEEEISQTLFILRELFQ